MRAPAAVPAGMLDDIQHWAPAGGFVSSEWRTGDRLAVGDLIRHAGAWAVITRRSVAVSYNAAGAELDRSPVIGWQAADGSTGRAILWASGGREVRTDTRVDPATLARQLTGGLWPTSAGKRCSMCQGPAGALARTDAAGWLVCLACAGHLATCPDPDCDHS